VCQCVITDTKLGRLQSHTWQELPMPTTRSGYHTVSLCDVTHSQPHRARSFVTKRHCYSSLKLPSAHLAQGLNIGRQEHLVTRIPRS
jgi:hypothetical protein